MRKITSSLRCYKIVTPQTLRKKSGCVGSRYWTQQKLSQYYLNVLKSHSSLASMES